MKLFHPGNCNLSKRHQQIYAYCELAYALVDFSAAALFVVGSILFFKESTTYAGTWLFLVGSIMFGLRPTIKLLREIAFIRLGQYQNALKSQV